jgi:hypothetical protein
LGGEAGSYSGRVVAPDGSPVPNASVVLPDYGDTPSRAETRTDADGRFTLTVTESERPLHRVGPALRIDVPDIGATCVDPRHLTVFPRANRDLGEIVLDPGRRYTGRVVDAEGRPIDGATVECVTYRYIMGHTVEHVGDELKATTNADGRFVTPVMPLGVPSIVAQKEGFVTKYHDGNVVRPDADGRLPDLVLPPSKPIQGRIVTTDGKPVVGAKVNASGTETTSDGDGRFTLHGFKDEDHMQLQVESDGFTFINWAVKRTKDGFERHEVAASAALDDTADAETYRKRLEEITVKSPALEVIVQPAAHITGTAVDAETGEPVEISRIVLCTFTRKENGEVVLSGCRMSRFEQPKPGTFSIEYGSPTEYHLTVSAPGYADGEAFTPPVTDLQPIENVVVKLTRQARVGESRSGRLIMGFVTENGAPLAAGRVGLWRPRKANNVVNAWITRGRTTAGDGYVEQSAVIENGRYSLTVPYQDEGWYLIVETPERVAALEGPFAVAQDERKEIDIRAEAGGTVRGRVEGQTPGVAIYAVLFCDLGLQYETHVRSDGSFEFAEVLPGEYGLKVGSDTLRDSEVPAGWWENESLEERLAIYARLSEPWRRAVRVSVREGQAADGLTVRFER